MYYYEIAVASNRYHGTTPLTYSTAKPLRRGAIIAVPLQRQQCLGVVLRTVTKPDFPTRPVSTDHASAGLLPEPLLQLLEWMTKYYPAPLGPTAQLFLPKDLPTKRAMRKPPLSLSVSTEPLPQLTLEQQAAISKIDGAGSYVIHGETGSGKTRLYMELAGRTLDQDKSCIILTPEISLTSQLAQNFSSIVPPERLYILHSQLTDAARRALWLRLANTTEPVVVIGPRSSLFSPLQSIGLIVLDESHEPAYKQESTPYYHAARVAATLASLHSAVLIYGSATPSVTEYYYAEQKKRPIIRLAKQAKTDTTDNSVQPIIVDMRDKQQHSNSTALSNTLIAHIESTLQQHQQSLLFLNRRGTARVVQCNACGWQALCPHCDLPLTYHQDSHNLRCHSCSHREQAPTSCPSCSNPDIIMKSAGTKAIETALAKRFPTARIARFDADNATGERIHELYEEVRSGAIDILVGTQSLAKGLDLPKLGLVGVINADASLLIPDFTAQERTYQLLYQIIGRVGRGHTAGSVVIQTYSPDNPTLQAAITKNWTAFYTDELRERKQFLFPPYCYLLKATCRRADNKAAQNIAESAAERLRAAFPRVIIDGPAPAFHEKVQNKYVWQIICKSSHRDELTALSQNLPADWTYDLDPVDLL